MRELKSIFAITDLTPASDACLNTAAALASAANAALHVVNGPPAQLPFRDFMRITFAPRAFMKRAAELMDAQIRRTARNLDNIRQEIHADSFSQLFIHLAHERNADLIVLSRSLSIDLIEAIAERSQLPTMVVHDALRMPVRRVVMPLASAVPSQHALAEARSWIDRLAALDHDQVEVDADVHLDLVQIAHISAASVNAAGLIRATLRTETSQDQSSLKLSWRPGTAETPMKQIRRVATRGDVGLIVSPMRPRHPGAVTGRLNNTNKALIRMCRSPLLIIPVAGSNSLTVV